MSNASRHHYASADAMTNEVETLVMPEHGTAATHCLRLVSARCGVWGVRCGCELWGGCGFATPEHGTAATHCLHLVGLKCGVWALLRLRLHILGG
eukprot:362798-Chlamydomonas_euryale.AAC.3